MSNQSSKEIGELVAFVEAKAAAAEHEIPRSLYRRIAQALRTLAAPPVETPEKPRPAYLAPPGNDPHRMSPCARCGQPWNQHKVRDDACPEKTTERQP